MNKYPLYVISKGRWDKRQTVKALEAMNAQYRVVIEPQEYDSYSAVIRPDRILVLPFSNLGQGSIPARNWVWEHSIVEGHKRHWILDDNIRWFARLERNTYYVAKTTKIFEAMEDFVNRYKNVALAGPQYKKFTPKRQKHKPFILNTRIYSCILIKNDLPFRWRGRFNEDTDLSLRVLKDGYCTTLFYAFIQEKTTTMKMKGGNTDEIYQDKSRLEFAQSLQRQHPDVVKVVWRYNRWHHDVDYSPFKNNPLVPRDDIDIPTGVNNYGMKLVNKTEQA